MDRAPARSGRVASLLLAILLAWSGQTSVGADLRFRVQLPADASDAPISGRLFVFLSKRAEGEPRMGPDWFNPEPFFAADVRDFRPGETRDLDNRCDSSPGPISSLPPGEYRAQAVLDHDIYHAKPGVGVGNLYSDVFRVNVQPSLDGVIELDLTNKVPEEPFPASPFVKEIVQRSELLSRFHQRPVLQRAAVVLPQGYLEHPQRRFPVMYVIPGFGGSHRSQANKYLKGPPAAGEREVEFIRVLLNGQCKWGHHVYANSAANGPRGDALVEELIPLIDRSFRTVPAATARFVTGHSSGGWSSLWLQVNYADTFGGVWSSAPDPVDFRDFQQVNLYAQPAENMYRGADGERRPLARDGKRVIVHYDSFCRMDDCLGRGGQLRSFEAVFSPLDPQGEPARLWDRRSGQINPQVADAWQAYDIRLLLERNWEQLGPKLAGKLHISTGEFDTFLLEGAVRRLAETLRQLGSDAEVEIVPGRNHFNLLDSASVERDRRQMSAAFLRHHPQP